ncbi:ubiquitin carboxyl-terminal hydrolase 27-like [Saccostrea echinata]|uniref:ubiquitin carboxyl-terminal hydrolase 27-like n=1 Tax=Saccostrea echinata TaxID=191078 RepID=UPI002A82A4B2|nr:ubiquitin carboxyl-terminal hydrolase 27-like [Saccostrea echinata]
MVESGVYIFWLDGTFDPNNQNDCLSFLHVLLDVLSKDENIQGNVNHFFIDVVDEIECRDCMTKQEIGEQRVLGVNSLTDISEKVNMDNLYGEELFENGELECYGCRKSRKLVKTSRLANCPALLMFQIQRILETGDGFVKRNCEIKFSPRLHLDNEMPKYELFAVVYHSGDLEGGHYYSAVKHDNDWYTCDNDHIWKCFEEKEILKFRDMYLLFYERK